MTIRTLRSMRVTDSQCGIVFVITMAVSEVFPLAPILSLSIYNGAIKKLSYKFASGAVRSNMLVVLGV